jgi:O-antigen/teichoic acid export membrane protein
MPERRVHASLILTGANLATAVVGLVVGLYVAHALGVVALGAVGVAMAIVAIVANVCDLRVSDLAIRNYYQPHAGAESEAQRRAEVLRSCMSLALIIGLATAAIGLLTLFAAFRAFSAVPVGFLPLACFALAGGLTATSNFLTFVHRLGDWLTPMVAYQVAVAVLRAAVIIGWLTSTPSIESYAYALFFTELVALVGSFAVALVIWRRIAPLAVLRSAHGDAWRLLRNERGFFFAANFMGYIKLLHRAGDLLLVAWFCGDRETGLYRFARSLADATLVLQDAIAKAYQPSMLRWIAVGDAPEFRRAARGIMMFGVAVGLGLIIGASLIGDPLIAWIVGPQFFGAGTLFAVLSVSVVFVVGVQCWLWPLVLAHHRLSRFVVTQATATVIGQYLVAILLFAAFPGLGVLAFALGHALTYVLTFAPALLDERKASRAYMPI